TCQIHSQPYSPKAWKPILNLELHSVLSREAKTPVFDPENDLANVPISEPRSPLKFCRQTNKANKKIKKMFIRALAHFVNQHPSQV
ncbi:TPA: hypothetical protein ACHXJD_004560, partial [Shigella sonnei]